MSMIDNIDERNIEKCNIEKCNIEKCNIEKRNIEKRNIKESNKEKSNLEESNIDESSIDESSIEESSIEENKIIACLQQLEAEGGAVIETSCAEETFLLGRVLGERAVPGLVCTLLGDLGVGKTVFSQGLAKGLGIVEPVSSPTFTIVQVYEEGRMPFYHFDVYRIADVEEMEEIGYEDLFYGEGACLIEWANLIEEILPEHYTQIVIEKDPAQGFDYRRIRLTRI